MGGCIMLLAIIFLGGLILTPEHPIAGMSLTLLILLFIGFLYKDNINTNESITKINNKSNNFGNPIIPHMYRKQIRRYFKK